MKLLDDYFDLEQQIHDYFGYQEDWRVIPLLPAREYFWYLDGESDGDNVHYAKTEQELADQGGNYYVSAIYAQRHLPRWVYRGEDYSMVCVDTNCDGNKFLMVFSNNMERPQ